MKIKRGHSLLALILFLIVGISPNAVTNGDSEIDTTIEYSEGSSTRISIERVDALLIELKREYNFTSDAILIEENSIHFKVPRLNNRAIDPYTTICLESKKNFFGYEICQKYGRLSIGYILCHELGLDEPSDEISQTQNIRASSNNHIGVYSYDGEDFSYLRTGSMLAGTLFFDILNTVTCDLIE